MEQSFFPYFRTEPLMTTKYATEYDLLQNAIKCKQKNIPSDEVDNNQFKNL